MICLSLFMGGSHHGYQSRGSVLPTTNKAPVLPTTIKRLCTTNNIAAPCAQKLGNGDGSSHV